LVFHCHAFQPISYQPDWELIQARKQAKINQNNQKENSSRIPMSIQWEIKSWLSKWSRPSLLGTSTWAHSKF
jgi:hypothetical protein